jgi:hypothetical protein
VIDGNHPLPVIRPLMDVASFCREMCEFSRGQMIYADELGLS